MRTLSAALAGILATVTLTAAPHGRDPQDMELRMKFAMAELVHYDVVGEYSAPTTILSSAGLRGFWSGANKLAVSTVHGARKQDPAELMKWAGAEIIHYDIVGEYSAPTVILSNGSAGLPGKWSGADRVLVKDRFEASLDWAPTKTSLVGKPTFKNFPSTVASNIFEGACKQPPPLSGSYDHLEVTDFKQVVGDLELSTRRTFPAGSVPLTNEVNQCGLHPVAARTETIVHRLPIIQGSFLAMPALAATARNRVGDEGSSAPNKLIVQKDGKTMVLDDSSRGWKYTYTLRIVK